MSKYVTDFTNPFYKKDVEKTSQSIVIPVTNSQSFKSVYLHHILSHCVIIIVIYLPKVKHGWLGDVVVSVSDS